LASALLFSSLTFANIQGEECLKYYKSSLNDDYTPGKHTNEAMDFLENMPNITGGGPMKMIFGLVNAVGLDSGYFQKLDQQRISQGQTFDLMQALHRTSESKNILVTNTESFKQFKLLVQERLQIQIADSNLIEVLHLDYLNSDLFCGTKAEGIEDRKTTLKEYNNLQRDVTKAHKQLTKIISGQDPEDKSEDSEQDQNLDMDIQIDPDQENKIEGAIFTLDNIIDRFVARHKLTD
jgi:hypothetical protein